MDLPAVRRLHSALGLVAAHLDRPDGLIDGQPSEPALHGVLDGVRLVVAEARGGFTSDSDPVLLRLTERLAALAAPGTELGRLEAGFLVLAEHVEPAELPGGLALLVDALLPSQLADCDRTGHDDRGLRGCQRSCVSA